MLPAGFPGGICRGFKGSPPGRSRGPGSVEGEGGMKKAGFLASVLILTCGAPPISAQTIGYGDSMKLLIEACGADVEAHCANVRIGSGRIEACLNDNISRLSQNCVTTWNAVIQQLQVRAAAQ